jgi:hypothetical protein
MRRALLTACLFLALGSSAHATSRTLVVSGSTSKASDWLPEGKPQLGDDLTIPVGKEGVVKTPLRAGDLTVEGELGGSSSIEVNGSVTFVHPVAWHETLTSIGLDELQTAGSELATVNIHGIVNLQGPLNVRALIWEGSTFDTNSYPVNVAGLAYPLPHSSSSYGTSTVTAGQWLDYPAGHPNDVLQVSSEATFLIGYGHCETTFKGAGWYYGVVGLGASCSTFSGDSYRTDELRLDSPVVTVEDGQTVEAEALTSNATAAHPVRVQAGTILGGPGGEATIDCDGCAVPPFVELVGVHVI